MMAKYCEKVSVIHYFFGDLQHCVLFGVRLDADTVWNCTLPCCVDVRLCLMYLLSMTVTDSSCLELHSGPRVCGFKRHLDKYVKQLVR